MSFPQLELSYTTSLHRESLVRCVDSSHLYVGHLQPPTPLRPMPLCTPASRPLPAMHPSERMGRVALGHPPACRPCCACWPTPMSSTSCTRPSAGALRRRPPPSWTWLPPTPWPSTGAVAVERELRQGGGAGIPAFWPRVLALQLTHGKAGTSAGAPTCPEEAKQALRRRQRDACLAARPVCASSLDLGCPLAAAAIRACLKEFSRSTS